MAPRVPGELAFGVRHVGKVGMQMEVQAAKSRPEIGRIEVTDLCTGIRTTFLEEMPMGSRKVHRREAQIPDHPELSLVIYGQDTANTTWSKMEQGYVVRLNGSPTPRSELAPEQREAVLAYLLEHHPEHAAI